MLAQVKMGGRFHNRIQNQKRKYIMKLLTCADPLRKTIMPNARMTTSYASHMKSNFLNTAVTVKFYSFSSSENAKRTSKHLHQNNINSTRLIVTFSFQCFKPSKELVNQTAHEKDAMTLT